MDQLVLSNDQSCDACISLVQAYNSVPVRKNDSQRIIKLLCCATKSSIAMHSDQSTRCHQHTCLNINHILTVLQTFSVAAFTYIIKQYNDKLSSNDLLPVIFQITLMFWMMCSSFTGYLYLRSYTLYLTRIYIVYTHTKTFLRD